MASTHLDRWGVAGLSTPRRAAILWSVLAGVTVLIYAHSLSGPYLYEDVALPPVQLHGAVNATRSLLQWSALTPVRLLERLSIWATQPFGPLVARIVSLGWFALTGVLLWALAYRVLSSGGAWMALGFWWLLPVQTEAVAYISARGELIAAAWLMLALLAVERRWLIVAWFCAAAAVTGKELGMMALAIVPIWAWCRGQSWTRRQVGVWGVACVPLVAGFLQAVVIRDLFHWISLTYVAAQVTALGRLLLLVPEALLHPSALTIDHDWIWITRTVAWAGVGGWIVALTALWRWPLWRFALLAAPVSVLPRLVLPIPDGLHDRHLTLAMVGMTLALGSWWGTKEPA